MNQRKMISLGSWVATIIVLGLGYWLGQRLGSIFMWGFLISMLALVVALAIWMGRKGERARLELQENFLRLARGKSIDELTRQHHDFLPSLRRWPEKSLEAIFEALDEDQARELRKALNR